MTKFWPGVPPVFLGFLLLFLSKYVDFLNYFILKNSSEFFFNFSKFGQGFPLFFGVLAFNSIGIVNCFLSNYLAYYRK